MVQFQAIRFIQNGKTFYSVCLTGKQLLDDKFAAVDKWSQSNPDGYQRDPSRKRFARVAEYLRGELGIPGVLPQSVLLGLRGTAKFDAATNTLSVPENLLPFREVDGQHRLGGIRTAAAADDRFHDYPVPAVICEDSSAVGEAQIFYNVNTTSIKVPVDLAQRLIAQQSENIVTRNMLINTGKYWVARATQIVDKLNTTPNQPWQDYILVPGREEKGQGVRQNTLVRSLRPLLTGEHVYKDQSADTIADLLIRYWNAIALAWPLPVGSETRQSYSLMRSVGVLTLHGIAPQIFEVVRAQHGKVTQNGLCEAMASMAEELTDDFWHASDGDAGNIGTNHKAVRFLSDKLLSQLNPGQMARELL